MVGHFEAPDTAPTAIDLFAGCGGVTSGLLRSGIDVRRGYELDDMARATYHTHHCEPNDIALFGDATDVDPTLQGDIDIIFAGPPCQDFSQCQGETVTDSERNELPFTVVDWAEAIEPSVCVVENVEGMRESHSMTVDSLQDAFRDAGYRARLLNLNAQQYGVPQSRDRVFIMAIRETADSNTTIPAQWKPPVYCNEEERGLSTFATEYGVDDPDDYVPVGEVIGDLPEPVSGRPDETSLHRTLADRGGVESNRYTRARVDPGSMRNVIDQDGTKVALPTNHVEADHAMETREKMADRELGRNCQPVTSRRLDPDAVAPTILGSNGTPPIHYAGQSPSHPDRDVADVRRLTVRECARIQGFMDTFTFGGTRNEQFQMVANAVPPGMAAAFGKHIRHNILDTVYDSESAEREATLPA
jgi:DNA (cytosine-5)-methyltransferase 1